MSTNLIGARFQYARELAGLTQAEASRKMGFKDRQTLSAIEAGIRMVSAEELVKAVEVLDQSIDFFTDPLRLVNEGAFTWHVSSSQSEKMLSALAETAGSYLALYRVLTESAGRRVASLEPRLVLEGSGTVEQAVSRARSLSEDWDLGTVPADRLETVVTSKLPFQVLTVRLAKGVLSGACRLAGFSTVFLSEDLSYEARSVELARQCFHLLTWEALTPPGCVVEMNAPKGKSTVAHTERMARQFVGEILLPKKRLEELWQVRSREGLKFFITEVERFFSVPAEFVVERLITLDVLPEREVNKLKNLRFSRESNGRRALFNKDFIRAVHQGLLRGLISERKLFGLLGLKREELIGLFMADGLKFQVMD